MKFKIDENLSTELGGLIRESGHDTHTVLEEALGGAADESIAKVCQAEERILITLDLDFACIKNYPPAEYHGIIVLRLPRQDRDTIFALAPRILKLLESEPVAQRLWIVDEQRTRIRG